MPRFAANLSMLFNEVDFLDRFEAASGAGFHGVEYQFPYDHDKELVAETVSRSGLTPVLHNFPAGDFAAGDRGIGCDPNRVGEFQEGVGQAIEYATAAGFKQLNCLAGKRPSGVDEDKVHETLVDNLRFAAQKLKDAGIRMMAEAVNTRDIPGFYLTGSSQALAIIEEVGSDNLWLQYDVYHMQIMEGDLTRSIQDNLDAIGHIQIADNPGRNEPGTGEINFPFIFDSLDKIGYDGWVGCEYRPLTTTEAGLHWADRYLR